MTKSWYEQEYCYLSEAGQSYVKSLMDSGLDFELAMELAFHTMPDTELYNLEEWGPYVKH